MTEARWLTATDPTGMLKFLKGSASDRKLRLFAVVSCRTAWSNFPNEACRRAVLVAESFADGLADESELQTAREEALQTAELISEQNIEGCGRAWARVAAEAAWVPVLVPQLRGSAPFLRDVFGNPFRPVAFNPAWRTSNVLALAEGIYQERAFGRMPVLADALEDAGCVNEDILSHCRSDGPHVRGCWVVDLLLGKD
ncbi:MAG TPA: hypothetical protein VH092_00435 [Urbifossiella sp.]|nr:hypothetical protein [Urbifossiella sp.]